MKSRIEGEVTGLLQAWGRGDPAALEELMPRVYAELRRIAGRHMAGERAMHTLQASALINEAYLRLIDWENIPWKNRWRHTSTRYDTRWPAWRISARTDDSRIRRDSSIP